MHYATRLRALVRCFPIDRVATVSIPSDPASASALTDAASQDDKQVWYHRPKLPKSESEQKRYYEMAEQHIFNKYFEELKHGSLNNELTARGFYEPTVALEKCLWNFSATNELGDTIHRSRGAPEGAPRYAT